MMNRTRDGLITAKELTRILRAMAEGATTPEDAVAMARLLNELIHPAMARMEEYSFTTSQEEMLEMLRMANAIAAFLGWPPFYPEAEGGETP